MTWVQKEKLCRKCKVVKSVDDFHKHNKIAEGVQRYHPRCKPCRLEDSQKTRAGKFSALAYTHVIGCRYSGDLYKFSKIDDNIPEGYGVIYKVKPGYLLPERYRKLESYHEKIT